MQNRIHKLKLITYYIRLCDSNVSTVVLHKLFHPMTHLSSIKISAKHFDLFECFFYYTGHIVLVYFGENVNSYVLKGFFFKYESEIISSFYFCHIFSSY